jgi:calcineurin-like phosphoesterase family protein
MKKVLLLCIAVFAVISMSLSSCDKNDSEAQVPESVKFMVVSDIHYFDPSLFTLPANSSFQQYLASDRKLIIESSDILNTFLKTVLAEKPDFLLVTGDLTKDGEKVSHQALAVLFETLRNKGIQVLVIPGNHDVNNSEAHSYLNNSVESVANVTPEEFATIYGKFGYSTAIERESSSLSYLSEPVHGVWVMGVDACIYKPQGVTAGTIASTTESWMNRVIANAKKENKILIGMMHHGIIEHFSGQSSLFSEYVVTDWNRVSSALADSGLNVMFTGHFHAQDIVKKTTSKGFLYDIETGSTVTSPCPYRIVTLNTKNKTLTVVSRKIDGVLTSTLPSGTTFQTYAKQYLKDGMKQISYYMLNSAPFNVPGEYIQYLKLDSIMTNAFVAHYAGDETATASDNQDIQTVTNASAILGSSLQAVWNDPAPGDNDVVIDLNTGLSTRP